MSQVLDSQVPKLPKLPKPPLDYPNDALRMIKPTEPKYAIWLTEDWAIYTRSDRPNILRRFFLWAFFGWRWTKVVPSKDTG